VRFLFVLVFAALATACGGSSPPGAAPDRAVAPAGARPRQPAAAVCPAGPSLRATFYDVKQGLAALVTLPDGRRVLVDAGESPTRAGCGAPCVDAHRHLLDALRNDLGGAPIDLLWVTHPHSDHLGGVAAVLETFTVRVLADNGRDAETPQVGRIHEAALAAGVTLVRIEPPSAPSPIRAAAGVTLTPILPKAWPASCARDPNDCSIALRIQYCASSLLFTGDAGERQEALLDPGGAVTLLQVGHHGSETSSSEAFLARVAPRYAVLSSGKPGEGQNRTYCHPRRSALDRLTRALGGPGTTAVTAFEPHGDEITCRRARPEDWTEVAVSDRLYSTSRDGDVHLETRGDGLFTRIPNEGSE
jgi:competence protein ComEC